MAVADVTCLYSTIKNTSGRRKTFGFLPPHGRTLAAFEDFTVFGDIRQALIRHERSEARRNIVAFENALKRNDIEILQTPSVVLEDENVPGTTKILTLRGGTLGVEDVCWNNQVSASPGYGG